MSNTRLLPASGRGDFHVNMAWLRENRESYMGKWVALRDGKLIDCDVSRKAMTERLLTNEDIRSMLFVKVNEMRIGDD